MAKRNPRDDGGVAVLDQPAPAAVIDTPPLETPQPSAEAGAHPPSAEAPRLRLYYVRIGSCPRAAIEAETPEAATQRYRDAFMIRRLDLETEVVPVEG